MHGSISNTAERISLEDIQCLQLLTEAKKEKEKKNYKNPPKDIWVEESVMQALKKTPLLRDRNRNWMYSVILQAEGISGPFKFG